MKVIILHDEISGDSPLDQQDNLLQVEGVTRSLNNLGHSVETLSFSWDTSKTAVALESLKPDLVFNLVESVNGMGQYAHMSPLLLESLSIPFTGSSAGAILLTTDKVLIKKQLKKSGLPTPAWITLEDLRRKGRSGNSLAGPFIIKMIREHASIGLDDNLIFESIPELRKKISYLNCNISDYFAEKYIDGREFSISMIAGDDEPEILPVQEIIFRDYPAEKVKLLGYNAKWVEESFEYQHISRQFAFDEEDRSIIGIMEEYAKECWRLFQYRGYGRVDFRVDRHGNPWIIDLNTNPCLSFNGSLMEAASRSKFRPDDIIKKIIHAALNQPALTEPRRIILKN